MNLFASSLKRNRAGIDIIDIILLMVALALLLQFDQSLHKRAIGIDFYQYWGVGRVIQATDGKVRNPYTEYEDFNRVLSEIAARSDDSAHKKVADFRKELELQATPFAYFMFSRLPPDYNLARLSYRYFQMGLFILTLTVLLRAAGCPGWKALLAALLLLQGYYPMFSELGVGNFNTVLMAGLTVALLTAQWLAAYPSDKTAKALPFLPAVFLLAWTGTMALMKPTMTAVAVVFVLFLAARFGIRSAVKAGFLSIIPLGLMASLPMIRFRSAHIWFEWFHYFRAGNLDMLALPAGKGNLSLPFSVRPAVHPPGMLYRVTCPAVGKHLCFKILEGGPVKEGDSRPPGGCAFCIGIGRGHHARPFPSGLASLFPSAAGARHHPASSQTRGDHGTETVLAGRFAGPAEHTR